MPTYTKMSRRDFVQKGFCPYTTVMGPKDVTGTTNSKASNRIALLFKEQSVLGLPFSL